MSPPARNRYSPLIACQSAMRNGKTSLSFRRHRRTIACGWKYAKLACNRPSVSRENKSNKQASLRWAKPKCAKTENHITFILTVVSITFASHTETSLASVVSNFVAVDTRKWFLCLYLAMETRDLFFSRHRVFKKNQLIVLRFWTKEIDILIFSNIEVLHVQSLPNDLYIIKSRTYKNYCSFINKEKKNEDFPPYFVKETSALDLSGYLLIGYRRCKGERLSVYNA